MPGRASTPAPIRRLRGAALALLAVALAGCPILPATYVDPAAREQPSQQRAVLHGAFRDYVFWYWQLTFVELDGQPIENWAESASKLELAPGAHHVVAAWEAIGSLGSLRRVVRCGVEVELEGGHDYHVLRLEDALSGAPETTLVIEDRAPGRETATLRLPCRTIPSAAAAIRARRRACAG